MKNVPNPKEEWWKENKRRNRKRGGKDNLT
jgi:hypothetical protein